MKRQRLGPARVGTGDHPVDSLPWSQLGRAGPDDGRSLKPPGGAADARAVRSAQQEPRPERQRVLDRLLPPWLGDASPEQRRQAKVVVLFSLSLASFGPPNGLLFWWMGLPIGALTCAVGVLTVLATVAVLHRTRSTAMAGHWLAGQMYFIVLFCAVEVGGLSSSALAWLGAVPVFAIMVAGRRAGGIWLAMVAAQVGGFAFADRFGWLAPSRLSEATSLWYDLVILVGAASLQMLLAWWYENEKRTALAAVEDAASAAQRAHDASRRILDNVSDGLVMIDARGRMASQRSAKIDEWFGAPPPDADLCTWIATVDTGFAEGLRLGLEQLESDWMPLELALAQLPSVLSHDDKTFELAFEPIHGTGLGTGGIGLLITFTDVSERVEAERARRSRADLTTLLERFGADPEGTRGFVRECGQLVAMLDQLVGADGALELARVVHTLKGNAGLFGLDALAETCHEAETRVEEGIAPRFAVAPIRAAWSSLYGVVAPLVGGEINVVSVARQDLQGWRSALASTGRAPAVVTDLDQYLTEATQDRLERLAEAASTVAGRLGKGDVLLDVDGRGVRVDPQAWRDLWPALVHVLRNAIDHGLEAADERTALGKSGRGTVSLHTRRTADAVILEVADDGRGVDWSRVAESARRRGLPCETKAELIDALFTDGLSTRSEVSAISGRGVGLAAVKMAVLDLDGRIEVDSTPGGGTVFRFFIPDIPTRRQALVSA